jgi:O-succinylbenzoate synthase
MEMAVLDAQLRCEDRSFASFLGVGAQSVAAGAVCGMAPTPGVLVSRVADLVAEGFSRVKVKISPGNDVDPLTAVRLEFPELVLQADANGSYLPGNREHLASLEALDELGLACLEQPCPAGDLDAHATLAAHLATPICLDESLGSVEQLETSIARGACAVACLKPGRIGGYFEAVRFHDVCRRTGTGLWCGGMLETGFARSANAALSAMPGVTLPGDLQGGERFMEQDPTGGLQVEGGRAFVHRGAGIGPAPSQRAMRELAVRSELFRP